MTMKKEEMRELMPETAAIVDWLRELHVALAGPEAGLQAANAIVLGGKQGKGTFWAQETGPDGVVREFGSRSAG